MSERHPSPSPSTSPASRRERMDLFTRLYRSDPSFLLLGIELRDRKTFGDGEPLPDAPSVARLVDENRPAGPTRATRDDHAADPPPIPQVAPAPPADPSHGDEREEDPPDERALGARPDGRLTIYPSLRAFVERFLVHAFAYSQHTGAQIQWVPDWWRHPSIVFPLDAIWRGYEAAASGTGGEMESWYFQTLQLFRMMFDKDTGLSDSVSRPMPAMTTGKDDPLPVVRPGERWRERILDSLDPVVRSDGEEPRDADESEKGPETMRPAPRADPEPRPADPARTIGE